MINIDNYLRIDPVDMIMVLISTFLIVVIAKKYFWNILKDYLDKRQQFIKGQLDEAIEKNKEGSKYCETSREELKRAQHQAKEILEIAEIDAKKEAEEIISSAKENAKLIKEKAMTEIQQERSLAANEMKEEMSAIALAVAEEILKKDLDDKDHHKLIAEFIDEAGESLWQA
ncbi:MAG: F0F1 ATP synthase subunit B [Clostridiaceae bacterium]